MQFVAYEGTGQGNGRQHGQSPKMTAVGKLEEGVWGRNLTRFRPRGCGTARPTANASTFSRYCARTAAGTTLIFFNPNHLFLSCISGGTGEAGRSRIPARGQFTWSSSNWPESLSGQGNLWLDQNPGQHRRPIIGVGTVGQLTGDGPHPLRVRGSAIAALWLKIILDGCMIQPPACR
jgi:hypothetical protein